MLRFLARVDRTFWHTLALLAVFMLISEVTNIDLWIQDLFFDFEKSEWMVDRKAELPKVFFYDGPKYLLALIGVGMLTLTLGPKRWRDRWSLNRRDLIIAIATLATAPTLISIGKATTNVFCPYHIERYGGSEKYVKVLYVYPEGERPEKRGKCFPAGHASGGFALWGMVGLASTLSGRKKLFLLGAAFGGIMGLYQMMKGAHFLSHTLVTVCIVWLVFLLWRKMLRRTDDLPALH